MITLFNLLEPEAGIVILTVPAAWSSLPPSPSSGRSTSVSVAALSLLIVPSSFLLNFFVWDIFSVFNMYSLPFNVNFFVRLGRSVSPSVLVDLNLIDSPFGHLSPRSCLEAGSCVDPWCTTTLRSLPALRAREGGAEIGDVNVRWPSEVIGAALLGLNRKELDEGCAASLGDIVLSWVESAEVLSLLTFPWGGPVALRLGCLDKLGR